MEDLFTTILVVNNEEVNYHVAFSNDSYTFTTDARDAEFSSFSVTREKDEWQVSKSLPADVKEQSLHALDRYLLEQH